MDKTRSGIIADPTELQAQGRPLGEGQARCQMSLDPYAAKPTFALNLELAEIPLVKLNDFARAYAYCAFASRA